MSKEDRERERALFEAERNRVPHLFDREPMVDTEQYLRWIGIEGVPKNRPLGYLRYMPQDFVVEEISKEKTVHTVDVETLPPKKNNTDNLTCYADLVKIGISTLDVIQQLAHLLAIEEKHIGYAGIKDRVAITGQHISIRNLADISGLENMREENFFIKNINYGKGAVANGDLFGNQFIITVRIPELLSQNQKKYIEDELKEIRTSGFWNFFYTQRFGTPRLLSHVLGLALVKQRYEDVVKTFVTTDSPRELPYFANIRRELATQWKDWQTIGTHLDLFPYHFHLERELINHLIKNPSDYRGALQRIPDQVRLWFYAYDCYLFNRKLSHLIQEGSVPLELPFMTSFNPHDWQIYREFLEADEVTLPSRAYRDFPFVRVESRTCATNQSIEIHNVKADNNLVVFAFTLPKGSYATSFLMNFFALASGLPLPPSIPTTDMDAKQFLGIGTLAPTLERFKTVLNQRQQDILASAE